jgi:hypothetical protein
VYYIYGLLVDNRAKSPHPAFSSPVLHRLGAPLEGGSCFHRLGGGLGGRPLWEAGGAADDALARPPPVGGRRWAVAGAMRGGASK